MSCIVPGRVDETEPVHPAAHVAVWHVAWISGHHHQLVEGERLLAIQVVVDAEQGSRGRGDCDLRSGSQCYVLH